MPALLFDLDGTLIHSDPLHEAVFMELWDTLGLPTPPDFYNTKVLGRQNQDIFREFMPEGTDVDALHHQKEAMFRDRLPSPFPAMPGAEALIRRAQDQRWPIALVTNAMRANAEAMLAAIGLRDFFTTMVIGEECARGKPAPDPYLEALRQLEVTPSEAIAFEDSPTGIRAAVAAGITTFGLRSSLDDAALKAAGATASLADFTDPALTSYLARFEGDPT